jgi:hypothetical protein
MSSLPGDIYTEPDDVDPDTLKNLGPLRPMAGIWEGKKGADVHPSVDGSEENAFLERIELQPIDPQTNGPQLFYGLRYHTRIVKPGEVETFHDQSATGCGRRRRRPSSRPWPSRAPRSRWRRARRSPTLPSSS